MDDEMQIGVFREPTSQEKQDFIPIGDKDPDIQIRCDIIQKINKRNRAMILKCKTAEEFQKAIKTLSCCKCFEAEHRKALGSDDFEEAFKKYQGRLKLLRVDKTYNKNGLEYQKGINIWFKRCEWEGGTQIIAFSSDEMSKELHDALYQLASKSDGEL